MSANGAYLRAVFLSVYLDPIPCFYRVHRHTGAAGIHPIAGKAQPATTTTIKTPPNAFDDPIKA